MSEVDHRSGGPKILDIHFRHPEDDPYAATFASERWSYAVSSVLSGEPER